MANIPQEPLITQPKCSLTKEEEQVDDEMVSLQALNITNSLAFPMVFKAALELGVLDTIAAVGEGAWLSSSEIAFALSTKPIHSEAPILLDRMLQLLVSHSILRCRMVERGNNDETTIPQLVYAVEPVCSFFLNRGEESDSLISLFMLHQSQVFSNTWTHLKDTVQEGKDAFRSAHGMRLFKYICSNEQFADMFNQGMSQSSTMIMKKILKVYKGFKDVNTLVDIGGGLGNILNLITSKYPHIKGINFDLAPVLARAPYCPGTTLADQVVYPSVCFSTTLFIRLVIGVEHVSGDMFVEVPKGDAIFMKWILHDWNEEDCVKILKNCWKSVPEKGKVIIAEMVTPTEPKSVDLFSKIIFGMDMSMLTYCSGGKERSYTEFEALASASGFRKCEVVAVAYSYSVIELYK